MFSSLDRIDIVAQRKDGVKEYWQSDHRTAEEIEQTRAISTLFALTRLLNPRRGEDDGPRAVVIYSAAEPPPEFLRQAIRAAGARLSIGDGLELEPEPDAAPPSGGGGFLSRALRGLFGGDNPAPSAAAAGSPSLDDILQDAFARLAREVAAEHGVALDVEGLRAVESALGAKELDAEMDETAYWTAVFQLGAFGGELIRASNGGRWKQTDMGTLPFALDTRFRGGEATVNPLGKAIKFLADGEGDSVVALVQVVQREP